MPEFVKWGSDWIKIADRVPYRYAIVWAKYGTGLKWVQWIPESAGKNQVESHGNFYGDTVDEAIESCQSAINTLINLDQNGYWYDVFDHENHIKKKSWL